MYYELAETLLTSSIKVQRSLALTNKCQGITPRYVFQKQDVNRWVPINMIMNHVVVLFCL